MNEILTAQQVGEILQLSTRQVYELAKQQENPIPAVRIRTSVRFRRSDVLGWVAGLTWKPMKPRKPRAKIPRPQLTAPLLRPD